MMKEYSYFSYNANEALHLSEQERKTVIECMEKIRTELQYPIDKHSKPLIVDNVKLLLDYCIRFYDRQFITRENANHDILTRFEGFWMIISHRMSRPKRGCLRYSIVRISYVFRPTISGTY